ncbi:acyltransferase domain-containing protein [Kitasatospora sp. NPDC056327]|uniref:acyltransferase domain-containing protein n=1 Tax=Kitasatospora sp. NPDC056327 TaxID=3345785 RepID=UPI0035E0FC22
MEPRSPHSPQPPNPSDAQGPPGPPGRPAPFPPPAPSAEPQEPPAPLETRLPAGLPSDEDLVEELLALAVPFEEVNGLLAARVRLARDAGLRALFEEMLRDQAAAVGTLGGPAGIGPGWPAGVPDGERFAALLFVALAPHTRALHRALGVPPEVTRSTLADLGRQIVVGRWRGRAGLGNPRWLTLHFRGELFQLGRLQFQRRRPAGPDTGAERTGLPGEWSLQVHIPDHCGPLSPGACDRALDRARAFFPRHFPGEPYRGFALFSWLLDPQLADRLPEGSNILRFQQRFAPLGNPDGPPVPEDTNPLRYVFGDVGRPLGSLPRDTALQRALVDHLRAGGHWYVCGGRLPF